MVGNTPDKSDIWYLSFQVLVEPLPLAVTPQDALWWRINERTTKNVSGSFRFYAPGGSIL